MSEENTKDKIIRVARVLFADHGFEGTSIRDIANGAEVNVASVNYYFSSKENLFLEIISHGYRECAEEMKSFVEKNNPSLEDSLVFLFRHFMGRSHDLISSFKIMMSAKHFHHAVAQGTEDEFIGPPGGKVIIERIRLEVGAKASEEDIHFALKTLFSHVTHQALIYNCCYKQGDVQIPFSSISDIEKGIRRLTALIKEDLKGK